MNNSKIKAVLSVLAFTIGVSIIPAINFKIDRWRVLNNDYNHTYNIIRPHPRVNANYLRTQYLIDNKGSYDGIIFGSSRVFQGFGTNQLNSIFGGNWYKLTYPGGAPYEHLHNLQAIIEEGAHIKEVIVAIDDADMYRYRNDKELYNFYPHPISPIDWLKLYKFYLFKPIEREDYDIIQGKKKLEKDDWTIDRFQTDGYRFPQETNYSDHEKRLLNLPPHGTDLLNIKNRMDETIKELIGLSDLCQQQNIKLHFFITPRYYRTYFTRDRDALDEYKRKLAAVLPFYDFTDFSDLVINPHLWRDPSHFTSEIGELILQRIEIGPESEKEFGRYVTKDSIETHLETINRESKALLSKLSESEPKFFVHISHQQ